MSAGTEVRVIDGVLHQFDTVHTVEVEPDNDDGPVTPTSAMCGEPLEGLTLYTDSTQGIPRLIGVKKKNHVVEGCIGCLLELFDAAQARTNELNIKDEVIAELNQAGTLNRGTIRLMNRTVSAVEDDRDAAQAKLDFLMTVVKKLQGKVDAIEKPKKRAKKSKKKGGKNAKVAKAPAGEASDPADG